MRAAQSAKPADKHDELLDQLIELLLADPSDEQAASFVISLLETREVDWGTAQSLCRQAIWRVYFVEDGRV